MRKTYARDRKADPGGRGNKIAKAGRVRKLRKEGREKPRDEDEESGHGAFFVPSSPEGWS